MKRIILVLVATLACSCSSLTKMNSNRDNDVKNWNALVGKWHGNVLLKDGEKREWVIERTNTGQYSIDFFTTYKDGSTDRQTERGEWGISGNIYFTIFKSFVIDGDHDTTDSSDPYNRDAYVILKLTDRVFEYRHARTGDKFKSYKTQMRGQSVVAHVQGK